MDRPPIRPAVERRPLVTFSLGDDLFAVDVQRVERVLHYREPSVVPNLPGWAVGVVEHAGKVVPVIDFRARFELPPLQPGAERKIIIFGGAHGLVAGIVDSVRAVGGVDPSQISPPPPIFRGLTRDYLVGIVREGERLIMLLDAEHLLSANERIVLERAVMEAAGSAAS